MHPGHCLQGLAPEDPDGFKRMLHQMWFSFYRRDGQADSCGFEHVFVGEHDSDSGEVRNALSSHLIRIGLDLNDEVLLYASDET
jgi:hypothetical protein